MKAQIGRRSAEEIVIIVLDPEHHRGIRRRIPILRERHVARDILLGGVLGVAAVVIVGLITAGHLIP